MKLVQDMLKVNLYVNFHDYVSNGVAVRVYTHRRTETRKDRTVFITSTADAGGKNAYMGRSYMAHLTININTLLNVGHTRFYLCCLRADLNDIGHELPIYTVTLTFCPICSELL